MSQTLTKDLIKQQVLTLLITKYENSPNGAPTFVTISDTPWVDIYNGGKAHAARERIHVVLRELEATGLTDVLWVSTQDEFQVSKVYLNLKKIELAYEESGVMRRNTEMGILQNILLPLSEHPWSFVQTWRDRANTLLSHGKTPGLGRDNADTYSDIVKALEALTTISAPMTVEQFSQYVYGSVQYFEHHLRLPLVKLLQDTSLEPYQTEQELLDSYNLITRPELALFAGHLHFAINSVAYNLYLFPQGIGLPLAGVTALEVTHIQAKRILMVESIATYYSLVEQLQTQRDLIVYTGGYPHYGLRALLKKLLVHTSATNSLLEVYYYGSISYYGIRIFEHLRQTLFPTLKPYGMDTATYEAQIPHGDTMCEKEATQLDYLMQDHNYEHWQPLLIAMLRNRVQAKNSCP
ncbi:MAG: DUF2399 domain-containing protein [Peptococcaceae bacterium]|nr:DUF2399 domain-containing protein [Peptococcaceae bacterium]